jgi:hypothetical protein
MKQKSLILFFFILGCKANESSDKKADESLDETNKNHYSMHYNFINSEKAAQNVLKVDITDSSGYEIKEVSLSNNFMLKYSEVVTDTGIIRLQKGEKYLTHSFKNDKATSSLVKYPPILNNISFLIRSKKIDVNNDVYEVFEYSEPTSGHSGTLSYYVRDIGFIIYCDKAHNSSYELSTVSGKKVIDTESVKLLITAVKSDQEFKISNKTVTDTLIPLMWWEIM